MQKKAKIREEEFIPPDGGYGWIVMLAAGFSNLSLFPVLQQFGLLFRDRFTQIGISSSQTTTIANVCMAMMYGAGLINGPAFRAFTFRQVALAGSILAVVALFVTVHAYNFVTYLLSFSLLYGTALGIVLSANALVLNTYWKKRRRIATGFSWTITGLGPIVFPYFVTRLTPVYGVSGIVLIFCGFALHAIACALLLQPVEWHSQTSDDKEASKQFKELKNLDDNAKKGSEYFNNIKADAFSSQCLFHEDDPVNTGNEMSDIGVLMMTQGNGFSSQSQSRAPSRDGLKRSSILNLYETRTRKSSTNLDESKKKLLVDGKTKNPESDSENSPILEKDVTEKTVQIEVDSPNNGTENADIALNIDKKHYGNETPQLASDILEQYTEQNNIANDATHKLLQSKENGGIYDENKSTDDPEKVTFCQKIVHFFDLDLLKDFTFLNLMIGQSLSNFSEINFNILTPFFLLDFGMTRPDVALFMSLVGGVDILTRFSVSLFASKIGLHNNTFFLIGVLAVAVGRVVLAHCQDRPIVFSIAVVIGFGSALRTIFMTLIIPTYVSLEKLPGATGLRLVTSGILFICLGPVVGWIKDNTSTAVTLHCLNIFTWLTAISWTAEKYLKRPPKEEVIQNL